MEDALVLARTSSSVTLLHRRDSFRASKVLGNAVLSHPKITVMWNTTVAEFKGNEVRAVPIAFLLSSVARLLSSLELALSPRLTPRNACRRATWSL